MCEFENLGQYAGSLEQRGLVEEAEFVRRVKKQGGEMRDGVVNLVENCEGLDGQRSEIFRRAKGSTKEDTHFSRLRKEPKQWRNKFESRK